MEAEEPKQATSPEPAMNLTDGNLGKPTPESVSLSQARQLFESDRKRVLHGVLGLGGIGEKPQHHPRDEWHVASVDGFLRQPISSACALDEERVFFAPDDFVPVALDLGFTVNSQGHGGPRGGHP
jgi:hypothetical protein